MSCSIHQNSPVLYWIVVANELSNSPKPFLFCTMLLFTADVRHHLRAELAEGPVLAGRADQVTPPLSRGVCSQSPGTAAAAPWWPCAATSSTWRTGGWSARRRSCSSSTATATSSCSWRRAPGWEPPPPPPPSPLVQTGENVDTLFHSLARLCLAQGLQQPLEYEQENTPSKTRCCGLLTR